MEELKIKAMGMELEVKGELETVKGASEGFYTFLDAKIRKDREEKMAFTEKLAEKMTQHIKPMEEHQKDAGENGEEGSCVLYAVAKRHTSWEAIAKKIKSGSADFHEGDSIDCKLKDGEEVTFVITEVTDEHVRFESLDCVGDKEVCWSKEGNTKCGLAISDVMNYLNDEIWNQLPDDLQRVIDPVVRKHKDSDGNIKDYRLTLFLPAASEVFDEDECYGDQGLYEQMEYYKDRRNRMRGAKKGEDTEPYWLASVRSGNSTAACGVNDSGHAADWYASFAFRVPVCFCIKKS